MKKAAHSKHMKARMAGTLAVAVALSLGSAWANAQQDGNGGVITTPDRPSSVPVPATIALVGLGIGGLIVLRRRK